MNNASGGKIIAKNTIFLYIRMLVILVIQLFTSRVILQALGIDDYGLYQTVGGIVGFLGFISNALSTATSRYITYALGSGSEEDLHKTFATSLTSHIFIGLLIVILVETLGLWYVYNKMVIPDERFAVALIVFHISTFTAFLSIVQVPYYAEVIAHEKMSVFAYVGIVEAFSKLGIIYLLSIGNIDKLVLYSFLLMFVQVALFLFYFIYCKKCFKEVSFKLLFDKKLFGGIFNFSSWSLVANGAIALSNQGILLLLNLFFAPAIVTARSISLQVNNVAAQFVQNFRTAVNPQVVKHLAAGDVKASHHLLLQSTKFSYYLMLLIALPLFLLAEPLLNLWLVEVPEYTVLFLQIVVIQSLFQIFDTSFYTALYAKGRIRENALLSPLVVYLCFPIVYVLFKFGASPIALSWAYLFAYAFLGCVLKPILIVWIADYSWKEILDVMRACLLVTIIAIPIPIVFCLFFDTTKNIWYAGGELVISIISVCISVWFVGLNNEMRRMLFDIMNHKLLNR